MAAFSQPFLAGTPRAPNSSPNDVAFTGSLDIPSFRSSPVRDVRAMWKNIPASWFGMAAYLFSGVLLGVALLVAMSLARAPEKQATAVTDNVVRLHAADIGESCWQSGGLDRSIAAKLTVSMEVGLDGKVRYAKASGASPEMRTCVEMHVRNWQFLPQSQASTMALPFEVDRH